MAESNFWSMDRLAATNLLASLKLEASAETLDMVAEHFARHRQSSIGWAAERAHSHMTRRLEAASTTYFAERSEEWADGFRFAEQQIATTMPEELLELGPDRMRTKGQVLRALVRQARQR
jgi:hypothetical protein